MFCGYRRYCTSILGQIPIYVIGFSLVEVDVIYNTHKVGFTNMALK